MKARNIRLLLARDKQARWEAKELKFITDFIDFPTINLNLMYNLHFIEV